MDMEKKVLDNISPGKEIGNILLSGVLFKFSFLEIKGDIIVIHLGTTTSTNKEHNYVKPEISISFLKEDLEKMFYFLHIKLFPQKEEENKKEPSIDQLRDFLSRQQEQEPRQDRFSEAGRPDPDIAPPREDRIFGSGTTTNMNEAR